MLTLSFGCQVHKQSPRTRWHRVPRYDLAERYRKIDRNTADEIQSCPQGHQTNRHMEQNMNEYVNDYVMNMRSDNRNPPGTNDLVLQCFLLLLFTLRAQLLICKDLHEALELLEILDPAATRQQHTHKSFRPFGTDGKRMKTTFVQNCTSACHAYAMLVSSCSSPVLPFHTLLLWAALGRKDTLYCFAWCFLRQGRLTAGNRSTNDRVLCRFQQAYQEHCHDLHCEHCFGLFCFCSSLETRAVAP